MDYLIAHFFEKVEIGETIKVLPLHMTLLHWFKTNAPQEEVVEQLKLVEPQLHKVSIEVGEEDAFGPDNDVAVNRVIKTAILDRMHRLLLDGYKKNLSVEATKPEHVGKGWSPHVSHVEGRKLQRGELYTVDSLHLVSRNHRQQIVDYIEF